MREDVKVAFLGSRPLAIRCLDHLRSLPQITLVGVVAPADPPTKWWEGSLRSHAEAAGLPLVEETDLLGREIDWVLSVLYPRIVKPPLLAHPRYGCINLHSGPLPRYRGRNGPAHAILNARKDNEWRYGATLHLMDEGVDTGPIIKVQYFQFTEDDTCLDVYQRTEEIALALFVAELPNILSNNIRPEPQGPGTYVYDKGSLAHKEVDMKLDPDALWDFVRAMYFPPFEKAYVRIGQRRVYLSPR